MGTNNTVVIIQNNHTNATEFLIITSQTVFFVLLFLLMKSALIDRRGMMYDYDRIQEEKLQLGAIFFAIFVFLAMLMIPLQSYEFVHFVVPITYMVICGIIVWEITHKRNNNKSLPGPSNSPPFNVVEQPVNSKVVGTAAGNFIKNPFTRSSTNTTFDY